MDTGVMVTDRAVIFDYGTSDPYDLDNLHGFNHATSVVAVPGTKQTLLASWFSGPYEASVHQSTMMARSEDGGRTWSRARVFTDVSRTSDFDPAFIALPETGELLAFFSTGRWTRWPFVGIGKVAREFVGTNSFQIWMKRSRDGGQTWTEAKEPAVMPGWNCRSNGIVLMDGTLLLPLHYLKAPHKSAVLRSTDGGETWQRSPDIVAPPRVTAAEPTIAQLNNGDVLMALRTRANSIWMVRSTDGGKTWGEPYDADIQATAGSHNLFKHSSGKLLLTYNPGPLPLRTRLVMRVSSDDGETWSAPVRLAEVEEAGPMPEPDAPGVDQAVWSRQVSYPSVAELADGTVVVVYGHIEMSQASQSGIIHSMRVRLAADHE